MQLRVVACIVIVALVRLLNLAVPILYKNTVNRLAEVSDLTHPRPGQPKEHFTFMDVRPLPRSSTPLGLVGGRECSGTGSHTARHSMHAASHVVSISGAS